MDNKDQIWQSKIVRNDEDIEESLWCILFSLYQHIFRKSWRQQEFLGGDIKFSTFLSLFYALFWAVYSVIIHEVNDFWALLMFKNKATF